MKLYLTGHLNRSNKLYIHSQTFNYILRTRLIFVYGLWSEGYKDTEHVAVATL